MKLSDEQIAQIIKAEEVSALDYAGELAKKRSTLLDYYNCRPYGNEVDGQSQAITSDVSDVIEWMLPSLIRIFTQGKLVAKFTSNTKEGEREAEEKTHAANQIFMQENDGTLILHNMFKDALLQFTGVVKVYWDEENEVRQVNLQGLSEIELQKLKIEDVEIEEIITRDDGLSDATVKKYVNCSGVRYDNIPPEEFLIAKTARDFSRPRYIGHRSPKSRSDLLRMGFDKKIVNSLGADQFLNNEQQTASRYYDYGMMTSNPANHAPNDLIYLSECYLELDVDGDGITEYWKIFYADDKILEKEQVDDHPFAVCVPVPIPHRAVGSCPAEQAADLQFRKSILVRQLLDNVYQTNYPRLAYSNKVELDDLLTPRSGGAIEINTDVGDVAGHIAPVVIPNMIEGVMQAIEYTDMEREVRTGITRYSQGLDAESLNKTATGFRGIMDASQQRLDLIARLFADGGVRDIFTKTVALLGKHQNEAKQIKVFGQPLEINPMNWVERSRCRIDAGIGAGDRQEKIINLNNILQIQERYMAGGLVLADQIKIFNTLEKLIDEVGLKDAHEYFNNPEIPQETLFAQNQQLVAMVQQLQQQVQANPLAEAEMIKAQAKMAEVQGKETNSMRQFIMKMAQSDKQFAAELARDLTELELKYAQNVPGALL